MASDALLLLGSQALALEAAFVTNNMREFKRLQVRIPDHRDRDFRLNVTGDSGRS